MWENFPKFLKVKPIKNTLKTKRIKLSSLTHFTKYIQQDRKHSKRKWNVLFNSRDVTNRVNSSKLKTLFTSNHQEAEAKIVCCSSSFNKICIVKDKDTDLTLFSFDDLRMCSSTTQAWLVHANRQWLSYQC